VLMQNQVFQAGRNTRGDGRRGRVGSAARLKPQDLAGESEKGKTGDGSVLLAELKPQKGRGRNLAKYRKTAENEKHLELY